MISIKLEMWCKIRADISSYTLGKYTVDCVRYTIICITEKKRAPPTYNLGLEGREKNEGASLCGDILNSQKQHFKTERIYEK